MDSTDTPSAAGAGAPGPLRMTVRRGTAADAPALAAFGWRVFFETFAPDNDETDLKAYLDAAYTPDRQAAEMADPAIDTWLLEVDGVLAAFTQLKAGAPPEGVAATRPIELWRFYVDRPWHGRGVAATLMQTVEHTARARSADTIWLGVWERNVRAQAFYRRQGFTVAGAHIFVLGSDPQRDLIMTKVLGPGS
ncbi:MAG: GNAT family N-acetyltransferase [Acidobacteria bacterium]|nr:GNAT family N-acetyltransferase [Acidobacteriota bacterium]